MSALVPVHTFSGTAVEVGRDVSRSPRAGSQPLYKPLGPSWKLHSSPQFFSSLGGKLEASRVDYFHPSVRLGSDESQQAQVWSSSLS